MCVVTVVGEFTLTLFTTACDWWDAVGMQLHVLTVC
jgi:hypothetical protein